MEEETLHCRWHPQRETMLRCYRCGAPICHECAHRTSVGYLCPDCVKAARRRFDRATWGDIALGGMVALFLGGLEAILAPYLGWLVIFIAPFYGTLAANLVWRAARRHHSERLWWIVAVLFSLPVLVAAGIRLMVGDLFAVLWLGVALALVLSTLAYTLRLK